MSAESESAKAKARATYNATSDSFDAAPLSFWNRFGSRTVERLGLRPGAAVLDVCAGSGASALPAAERVGAAGRVVAVDLAESLLALGREKCRARGLDHVEFRSADMERLEFPDESFDAVVCVFGIFFVPDMAGAIRELWRMVRPGGQLAITTWGRELFEPANSVFWESIRSAAPALHKAFHPWDRIASAAALCETMETGGARPALATAEAATHELRSSEDWWTICLGTGYRGTIEALDPEAREHVRRANLEQVAAREIRSIRTDVVYGTARKPARAE